MGFDDGNSPAVLSRAALGVSRPRVLALGVAALVNARRSFNDGNSNVFAASQGFVNVNATNRRPAIDLSSACALGLNEAAFQ